MSFFQIIVPPLNQPLTYKVPDDSQQPPCVGQRVLVFLKKKQVTGFLWEKIENPLSDVEIKPIVRILDPQPLFSRAMVPFFSWIADYYLHPLGLVLKTALPPGLSVSDVQKVVITPLGKQVLQEEKLPGTEKRILQAMIPSKGRAFPRFSREEKKILKDFEKQGWIQQTSDLKKETARPLKEKWVYPGAF